MLTKADLPAGWRVAKGGGVAGTSPTVQRGETVITRSLAACMGITEAQAAAGPRWPGRRSDGPGLVPDLHGPTASASAGSALELQRPPPWCAAITTNRPTSPSSPIRVSPVRGHGVGGRAAAGRRPDLGDRATNPDRPRCRRSRCPLRTACSSPDCSWPSPSRPGRPTSRCRWSPSRWGPTGSRPACRSSPSAARSRASTLAASVVDLRAAGGVRRQELGRLITLGRPPTGPGGARVGPGRRPARSGVALPGGFPPSGAWATMGRPTTPAGWLSRRHGRIMGPEILATCGRRRQDGRTDARRRGEPSAIMRRSP